MPYGTESKSRNADFISIAAERQSATLIPLGLSPPERSDATLLHNLRGEAPSTLTPKVCPGKVCPLFIQYFQQSPCFFYGELAGSAGFFSGGEGEGGAQVVPGGSGENA